MTQLSAMPADRAVPDPFRDALDRLEEFRKLPPDWDSYGADPVSEQATRGVRDLFRELAAGDVEAVSAGLIPFDIGPLPSGGVQIEWRGNRLALEVEVGPDQSLGYLLIDDRGERREYTERDDAGRDEVVRLVRELAGINRAQCPS